MCTSINEDEFLFTDLLDKAIKQMDMALNFVTGLKTKVKTVFVYDGQDVIYDIYHVVNQCVILVYIRILTIVVLVYY